MAALRCRDANGWTNYLGLACADYERRGWCRAGQPLRNTGDVFGHPERHCCACGRERDGAAAKMEHLFFMATHSVPYEDALIWRQYVRELNEDSPSRGQLWLLIFLGGRASNWPHKVTVTRWRSLGASVCLWSEKDVFRAFPRIPEAMQTSKAFNRTIRAHEAPYIAQYFWFHASLAVWRRWHGDAYPSARYLWRLEPDVVYAGHLRSLLRWSELITVDVLLPNLIRRELTAFIHFTRDWERFAGIPPSRRVWSLVCLGRYSFRFLMLLERLWTHGTIGYEELLIPIACTMAQNCSLEEMGSGLQASNGVSVNASRVRFRPVWSCEEFLDAVKIVQPEPDQ